MTINWSVWPSVSILQYPRYNHTDAPKPSSVRLTLVADRLPAAQLNSIFRLSDKCVWPFDHTTPNISLFVEWGTKNASRDELQLNSFTRLYCRYAKNDHVKGIKMNKKCHRNRKKIKKNCFFGFWFWSLRYCKSCAMRTDRTRYAHKLRACDSIEPVRWAFCWGKQTQTVYTKNTSQAII